MSSFRTELHPLPADRPIELQDTLLGIGSCFADRISGLLQQHKFPVLRNPFGVLFNPIAVAQLMTDSLEMPESGFVQRDERWVHLWAHSDLHAPTLEALRQRIREQWQGVRAYVPRLRYLLLTWGTAWVYEDQQTGHIVANCHKQPATRFRKRLLQQEEVQQHTAKLLDSLPDTTQVILTVSPVRHLRDTLPLNAVSKSLLRLAAHELSQTHPQVHYFPAYELLLDDLRDYRFYATDLLHPSEEAMQYVWQKFVGSWLSQEAQDFIRRWARIERKLAHRAFNPHSAGHQRFLRGLQRDLEEIATYADVQAELKAVQEAQQGSLC